MKSVQEDIIVELLLQHRKKVHFPLGIMGVDTPQDFFLVADAGEAPLIWLEEVGNTGIVLPVIDPYLILPEYAPEFSIKDLETLHLDCGHDLLVLSLVSMLHLRDHRMTANLAAPLLINWRKSFGRQGVVGNRKDYPSNFPLSNFFERQPSWSH